MNGGIRRVGFMVTALMLILLGQLTYLQMVRATPLAKDPRNIRTRIRDYSRPRGAIVTADGEIVARSIPTTDEFKFQREYPLGDLFGHVTGFQSFVYGNTGLEDKYNGVLVGRDFQQQVRSFGDILINRQDTGTVVLTMSRYAQELAKRALNNQRGSVVVIDPTTGAIVAMYSNPTYDPNPLAGHDAPQVQAYYGLLNANPEKPGLLRAIAEIYPPGSTFKIVTTAVALANGIAAPEKTYPVLRELGAPNTTRLIKNFGDASCGGTLAVSFQQSCNTTFVQVGLDLADRFPPGIDAFGVSDRPPLDLPGAARGTSLAGHVFKGSEGFFAQAGIGQGFIAASPLEMALIAGAIANHGDIMKPHVVSDIQDSDGAIVRHIAPELWKSAVPPLVAEQVKQMMVSVVEQGTGTAARIPGISVAGKTGTAQTDSGPPHAWFVGFAPAEAPRFAIAVLIEHGGVRGNEATGGRVAAPIAAEVLRGLLGQ